MEIQTAYILILKTKKGKIKYFDDKKVFFPNSSVALNSYVGLTRVRWVMFK